MEENDNNTIQYKGQHAMIDFKGIKGDEYILGKFIFDLMIRAIERTSMKIVHKHLEILNKDTPPGFTSALLLLDSSHCTSHCYSDIGMLAIDIFTCNSEDNTTDVMEILQYMKNEIIQQFPDSECTFEFNQKRFRF